MLTPEQEYYARVCERDASWHVFCDCPTDSTWARYQDACKAVTAAEQGAQPTPLSLSSVETLGNNSRRAEPQPGSDLV